ERALVDGLAAGRGDCDNAGNFLRVAFLAQQLVDLRLGLHGGSPPRDCYYGERRSSSGSAHPASGRESRVPYGRDFVIERGCAGAPGRATRPICNTSPQLAVDELQDR